MEMIDDEMKRSRNNTQQLISQRSSTHDLMMGNVCAPSDISRLTFPPLYPYHHSHSSPFLSLSPSLLPFSLFFVMHSSSVWFPLVQSAHLPLSHFTNVYSTSTCLVSRPSHDGHGTIMQPQVLCATVHELFALQHHTTHTTANSTVASAQQRSLHKSKSNSNNLATLPPAALSSPVASSFTPSSLLPLPLSRLPCSSGVELLALTSFNQSSDGRPIICVAAGIPAASNMQTNTNNQQQGKTTQTTPSRFVLNIYGLNCPLDSDLLTITQDCFSIRLNFVPFVLTHSALLSTAVPSARNSAAASSSSSPPPFLTSPVDIILSGSDHFVHLYRWNGTTYAELPLTPSHPLSLLHHTPSSVLSIDFACAASDPNRTYMVAGCQDGLVRFASLKPASHLAHELEMEKKKAKEKRKNTREEEEEVEEEEEEEGASWQSGGVDINDSPDIGSDEWSDFYVDGPVSSAAIFSPSIFLADAFRSRKIATDPLNDNALNQMQRRAFDACIANDPLADASSLSSSGMSGGGKRQAEVRLLMANTVGFGAVYGGFDPDSLSFHSSWYLNGSGCFSSDTFTQLVDPATDAVLCAAAFDVNMDGRNEVVLGTYASQLLVYAEWRDGEKEDTETTEKEQRQSANNIIAPNGYRLAAMKQFAHPIYSVRSVDLHGEGIDNLVLTTQYSVDVLSWDVESAVDGLTNKLEAVEEIRQLEEEMKKMKIRQANRKQQQQIALMQQQQQADEAAAAAAASLEVTHDTAPPTTSTDTIS